MGFYSSVVAESGTGRWVRGRQGLWVEAGCLAVHGRASVPLLSRGGPHGADTHPSISSPEVGRGLPLWPQLGPGPLVDNTTRPANCCSHPQTRLG